MRYLLLFTLCLGLLITGCIVQTNIAIGDKSRITKAVKADDMTVGQEYDMEVKKR